LINLGSWEAGDWKQSEPPMIPMTQLFKTGEFPLGEIQEHYGDHNRHRITSAELRAREKILESDYDALRRAAEVHRHTRKWAQKFIKPGMKVMDICNEIEATNRRLIEASGLDAGIAFPTGASLNHCAAHWTPNIGDETVLQKDDVMKIDFGSHVRGIMTDCAFTVAFNPTYENLLKAVKDATDTGIRHSGIDARLGEIGEAIQETMESYEVEIKNKTYKVKAI
jgi:methionyl aminopeptidase